LAQRGGLEPWTAIVWEYAVRNDGEPETRGACRSSNLAYIHPKPHPYHYPNSTIVLPYRISHLHGEKVQTLFEPLITGRPIYMPQCSNPNIYHSFSFLCMEMYLFVRARTPAGSGLTKGGATAETCSKKQSVRDRS
ncbi:hypothetical protein RRG08_020312, partial [Elysia crispata]